MKSEIRRSKSEGSPKSKGRRSECRVAAESLHSPSPSVSEFGVRISFGFWISGFGFATLALALLLAGRPVLAATAKSSLADAAEKSDRAIIRTLLKQHDDVNAPQADGMTALHWAAQHDDLETAKLLVKAKASVTATNRYGVTPLSQIGRAHV